MGHCQGAVLGAPSQRGAGWQSPAGSQEGQGKGCPGYLCTPGCPKVLPERGLGQQCGNGDVTSAGKGPGWYRWLWARRWLWAHRWLWALRLHVPVSPPLSLPIEVALSQPRAGLQEPISVPLSFSSCQPGAVRGPGGWPWLCPAAGASSVCGLGPAEPERSKSPQAFLAGGAPGSSLPFPPSPPGKLSPAQPWLQANTCAGQGLPTLGASGRARGQAGCGGAGGHGVPAGCQPCGKDGMGWTGDQCCSHVSCWMPGGTGARDALAVPGAFRLARGGMG